MDESEDLFNKITASSVNQPEVVGNSKEKEQGGGAQAAQSSPSAPRTQRAKAKAKGKTKVMPKGSDEDGAKKAKGVGAKRQCRKESVQQVLRAFT